MNKVEYLLVCLMEECAELQQAASKSLRFSPNGVNCEDVNAPTNAEVLLTEFLHVAAIMQELQDAGVVPPIHNIFSDSKGIMTVKKCRLDNFMDVSRAVGTLTE